SIFDVEDHTRSSLYHAGRNSQTDKSFGWEIFSFVRTCNDFPIRCENTRGSEFFIACELVFSFADELVIQLMGAHNCAEFFKSEIEDIPFFTQNVGLDKPFSFSQ